MNMYDKQEIRTKMARDQKGKDRQIEQKPKFHTDINSLNKIES